MNSARSTIIAFAAAAGLALPLSAQTAFGVDARGNPIAPVPIDTTGMFQAKAASVGPNLFISGQPTAKALTWLHDQGVTTVINLRTEPEMTRLAPFVEEATLQELGMTYVHIPVRGTTEQPYSPQALKTFSDALAGAHGKVLLHCTIAWRASHMWAAYLIQEKHAPVETALALTRSINLMDKMHGMELPVELFLGRTLPELHK